MKIFLRLTLIVGALLSAAACTNKIVFTKPSANSKLTAPGQLKKQTGSQSAKQYAPDQMKKKK